MFKKEEEEEEEQKQQFQMTSLALFPQLRRTLTDVMEDELYHVPTMNNGNSTNSNNSQQLHQHQSNGNNPNLSTIMQNYHLNNSNNSFKSSPTLQHSRLFRNPSALNSEEMLTIPDTNQQQQQHQPQTQHFHSQQPQHSHQPHQLQNQELSRIPSHDMYYDIPEPLPYDDEDRHIFNEYADPNLTTTNHIYRSEQHFAQQNNELQQADIPTTTAPAKLLKFNDDLTLDYFTNDDDSKFVIYPVMSPNLIPEEIEEEELSDEEDEFNSNNNQFNNHGFTYLDNNINDVKNPLTYQHLKFQAQQEEINKNEQQLAFQQEELNKLNKSNQSQINNNNNDTQNIIQDDITQDIESDIDHMSLDSSDDEYSSNSSVMDEDMYTPSFKTETPQSSYTSPKASQQSMKPKTKRSGSMSNVQSTSNNHQHQNSPSELSNVHQCHLINPSTNQPCLKQFSRPYDLIRHQETIHASKKKIFRCVVCNKLEGGLSNKTFSRGDALSRHIRVKHGLTGTEATDALQYAKDHVEYV